LLKALAPVHVLRGLGKFPGRESQVLLVDITNGDHVFVGNSVEVRFRPAPGAQQGDVQLVARRIRSKEIEARKNESRRSDEGGGFKKLAPFDEAPRRRFGRTLLFGCLHAEILGARMKIVKRAFAPLQSQNGRC